jgi:molybdopterin converting factor small subunit
MEKKIMTDTNFKRIDFNENVERHLIFKLTPEKKLLSIIQDLKEVFPRQKEWRDLTENRAQKVIEILDKFRKKGKLFKKVCQYWLNNNTQLIQAFNDHFQNIETEISTDDVVKFFAETKKKFSLDNKDIVIFVHLYLEQSLGIQLFEDSAKKIEAGL